MTLHRSEPSVVFRPGFWFLPNCVIRSSQSSNPTLLSTAEVNREDRTELTKTRFPLPSRDSRERMKEEDYQGSFTHAGSWIRRYQVQEWHSQLS